LYHAYIKRVWLILLFFAFRKKDILQKRLEEEKMRLEYEEIEENEGAHLKRVSKNLFLYFLVIFNSSPHGDPGVDTFFYVI
jgi:hypothetical protein